MNNELDDLLRRGEPIAGQLVPARDGEREKIGGNARRDRHNGIFYDSERADVCLNCPLPDCEGTRRCFKAMRDTPAKVLAKAAKCTAPKPKAAKKSGQTSSRKKVKRDSLDLDIFDFAELNSFYDEFYEPSGETLAFISEEL